MKCSKCGVRIFLQADIDPKVIDGKAYCDDCYFDLFGEMIEENPIGVFPSRSGEKL